MCEDSSEGIGFDVTIYAPRHLGLSWDKEVLKYPFTETVRLSIGNANLYSKTSIIGERQPNK